MRDTRADVYSRKVLVDDLKSAVAIQFVLGSRYRIPTAVLTAVW